MITGTKLDFFLKTVHKNVVRLSLLNKSLPLTLWQYSIKLLCASL
jgi:hypothetical protein